MGVDINERTRAGSQKSAVLDLAFCILLAVAHIYLTFQFQPRCVETFDMAIAMDGGYRVYCGQMPYRDFHIPTGPMRHYTLALCYLLTGGFSWWATILWAGIIGAAASVLVYYILRVFCGRLNAMVFAAMTALTFNLPVAFPWFDHEAFLWTLAALAAFALVHAAHEPSTRRLLAGAALSGVALTLSLMTKQNIGGAALILVSLLWLAAPLPRGTIKTNLLAATCCLISAIASAALMAVYFEWHGDFREDFFRAGSQMQRLQHALGNFGVDLINWPDRDDRQSPWSLPRLDSWSLVLAGLFLLAMRICGVRLGRRQWTIALLALCGLMVTLAGRLTGSAPGPWFCALMPLSLGLLTNLARPPDPLLTSVAISPPLARALALLTGVALLWRFAPAFLVAPWLDPTTILDAGRRPIVEDYYGWLGLAIFGYFGWQLFRLAVSSTPRLGLLSLARPLLFIAIATLTLHYSFYIHDRKGWTYSPAAYGEVVPFTKIPALSGCDATPIEVSDFEELYEWWQLQRRQFPNWRPGQDLFILPNSQQFYALLGEESFRHVRLWYDPGLTYQGLDPDTEVLESTLPALIILQVDGRPYQFQWWTSESVMQQMPRFEQLLHERYTVIKTMNGFVIWALKKSQN